MAEPVPPLKPTSWQQYEALTDLEIQEGQKSDAWIQAELARCSVPIISDPSQGFWYWARRHWWLVDRRGMVRRLLPNAAQEDYLERAGLENVILKPRKRGFSTIIDARAYWECLFRPNLIGSVVTHRADSTAMLWERLRFAHDRLPPWMKPSLVRSSLKELKLAESGSRLMVFTAGGHDIGAGGDQDIIHLSEVALYLDPDAIMASLVQSKRHGARVDFESTARGFNRFHSLYQSAKDGSSGRVAFFFPWFDDPMNVATPDPDQKPTQEEADLAEVHHLAPEQIAFRRKTTVDLGPAVRAREYPDNDVSCFMASTASRFNVQQLTRLRAVVEERVQALDLYSVAPFFGDDQGRLKIWKMPEPDAQYVVGADVAEGLPDGDFSAAGVLDVRTCEQMAAWHGRIDPGAFAHVLAQLGAFYNQAIIAPERNNHGHATILGLMRVCAYDPIYQHLDYDQLHGSSRKAGWPTTSKTRPIMLSDLSQALDQGHMIVRDAEFVGECITFGEADGGASEKKASKVYRDRVFAWAIAWQVRAVGLPSVF